MGSFFILGSRGRKPGTKSGTTCCCKYGPQPRSFIPVGRAAVPQRPSGLESPPGHSRKTLRLMLSPALRCLHQLSCHAPRCFCLSPALHCFSGGCTLSVPCMSPARGGASWSRGSPQPLEVLLVRTPRRVRIAAPSASATRVFIKSQATVGGQ